MSYAILRYCDILRKQCVLQQSDIEALHTLGYINLIFLLLMTMVKYRSREIMDISAIQVGFMLPFVILWIYITLLFMLGGRSYYETSDNSMSEPHKIFIVLATLNAYCMVIFIFGIISLCLAVNDYTALPCAFENISETWTITIKNSLVFGWDEYFLGALPLSLGKCNTSETSKSKTEIINYMNNSNKTR